MTIPITREETLLQAAKKLDIPPSKYKEARTRFRAMDNYLSDGNYAGATPPPDIYLQGSFKIGTEIRPYKHSKDADYDIDIVCCLGHQKNDPALTPSIVKHQVGAHLRASNDYRNRLDNEGKRCWTIKYSQQDDIGFHIDVVPAVPEPDGGNAIAITNRNNTTHQYKWSPSNPKDFAMWFRLENGAAFELEKQRQKHAIFDAHRHEELFIDQAEVPNIHVKTPLQRAIQLLKRHRDIAFCNKDNEKCKPISMIITVLATRIYNNEATIEEILQSFINTLSVYAQQMPDGFQPDEATYPLITKKGRDEWYIPNPTNCRENFADKWHKEEGRVPHARAKAFFDWIEWLRDDFMNWDVLTNEDSYGRQRPIWKLPMPGEVTISGRFNSTQNGIPQNFNSNQPLEQLCNLWFTANTDITGTFRVYWQVVNTGEQAKNKPDLRGGIIRAKADGLTTKEGNETTRYVGTHWIRCFIVQNSICVACSHKFLVQIR